MFRLTGCSVLAVLGILTTQSARSQDGAYAVSPPIAATRSGNPVEQEIVFEGLVSYGNWRIFAGGQDCKLFTAGIEYDRHSWDYFIKARMDYVAEILPFVLLRQPAKTDIWGDPFTLNKKMVPGLAISPIGLRMVWLDKRAWKPYFIVKGGMIAFTEKAISDKATYESFSLQQGFGVQVRMTDRADLRLGLFNDFHFSNAFMVPVNPGLDVMNATFGISYHLDDARPREHHRRRGFFRAAANRRQDQQ